MAARKTTVRKMTTTITRWWHVRLISADGESPLVHKGWIVEVNDADLYPVRPGIKPARDEQEVVKKSWKMAIERVKALNLDNDPDGEWSHFPELTADILEFNPNGVAELY